MKNKQILLPIITCLIITGLFASCKKNDKIKANVPVFKVEIFKQQLKAGLSDARGFQFVITKDGVVADTAAVGLGGSGRTGNIPRRRQCLCQYRQCNKDVHSDYRNRLIAEERS